MRKRTLEEQHEKELRAQESRHYLEQKEAFSQQVKQERLDAERSANLEPSKRDALFKQREIRRDAELRGLMNVQEDQRTALYGQQVSQSVQGTRSSSKEDVVGEKMARSERFNVHSENLRAIQSRRLIDERKLAENKSISTEEMQKRREGLDRQYAQQFQRQQDHFQKLRKEQFEQKQQAHRQWAEQRQQAERQAKESQYSSKMQQDLSGRREGQQQAQDPRFARTQERDRQESQKVNQQQDPTNRGQNSEPAEKTTSNSERGWREVDYGNGQKLNWNKDESAYYKVGDDGKAQLYERNRQGDFEHNSERSHHLNEQIASRQSKEEPKSQEQATQKPSGRFDRPDSSMTKEAESQPSEKASASSKKMEKESYAEQEIKMKQPAMADDIEPGPSRRR